MKYLFLLLLVGCSTSTGTQDQTILCYAYDEPGIVAWGANENEAEQNMKDVNCHINESSFCRERGCDKFEVL